MAPHPFSIAMYRWIPLSIYALLCVSWSNNGDWGMVNGFEVVPSSSSSRYTAPKRIIQQQPSLESSSSLRYSNSKYDLGLGKNAPIHPPPKGRPIQPQQQQQQGSERSETTTAYEACRFLVEHEATRVYPGPNHDNNRVVVHNNNGAQSADTETTPTLSSSSASAFASNGRQATKSSSNQLERKAEGRRTNTAPPSERSHNRPPPKRRIVRVQPKRLLEDCLTILDHDDLSAAASPATTNTATITAATTNSTISISSSPDAPTPQLDMNSIWVEMLLHNQMARSSQTQ